MLHTGASSDPLLPHKGLPRIWHTHTHRQPRHQETQTHTHTVTTTRKITETFINTTHRPQTSTPCTQPMQTQTDTYTHGQQLSSLHVSSLFLCPSVDVCGPKTSSISIAPLRWWWWVVGVGRRKERRDSVCVCVCLCVLVWWWCACVLCDGGWGDVVWWVMADFGQSNFGQFGHRVLPANLGQSIFGPNWCLVFWPFLANLCCVGVLCWCVVLVCCVGVLCWCVVLVCCVGVLCYVVVMWLLCGCYVVVMWLLCGGVQDFRGCSPGRPLSRTPRPNGPPLPGPPSGGPLKISLFFSPLPPSCLVLFLSLSLGVFSWNFGGV